MKSWVGTFVSECFWIEKSRLKISLVLFSKCLKHPDECYLICFSHIVSDFLEFTMRFKPWMLQEVSINRGNLVRLTDLNRDTKDIRDDGFYSISSIDHGKTRRILRLLESPENRTIVLESFLEDMFRGKNISGDCILSYEYSPLCLRSLFSEEGSVENEDGGTIHQ